ncbi:nucleic acid-binding protein, partial [Rozella allomycis CSF55]
MAERPLNRVTTIAAEKVRDDYAETASEEFYMFLESFAEQGSVLEPGMLDTETSMIKFTSDVSTNPKRGNLVYVQQLNSMRHDNSQTLYVDFNHVLKANETLATAIMNNYYRFVPYLEKAVYMFVKRHMPEYVFVGGGNVSKEFSVAFKNLNVHMRIREMTTKRIGMLMKTSGTITRTSEVKPELNKATFQCVLCGGIVREVVQQFKYTEPQKCVNPICMNKKEWRLLIEQSVFMNWQKIHIQENSNEIPAGSMPRTMIVVPDVSVMSLPGGKIEKSREGGRSKEGYGEGISGLKSLGVREMSYKLVFVACYIEM